MLRQNRRIFLIWRNLSYSVYHDANFLHGIRDRGDIERAARAQGMMRNGRGHSSWEGAWLNRPLFEAITVRPLGSWIAPPFRNGVSLRFAARFREWHRVCPPHNRRSRCRRQVVEGASSTARCAAGCRPSKSLPGVIGDTESFKTLQRFSIRRILGKALTSNQGRVKGQRPLSFASDLRYVQQDIADWPFKHVITQGFCART